MQYYVICPNLIMGPYETETYADKRRALFDASVCEWAGSHAVVPARSYKDAQAQQWERWPHLRRLWQTEQARHLIGWVILLPVGACRVVGIADEDAEGTSPGNIALTLKSESTSEEVTAPFSTVGRAPRLY